MNGMGKKKESECKRMHVTARCVGSGEERGGGIIAFVLFASRPLNAIILEFILSKMIKVKAVVVSLNKVEISVTPTRWSAADATTFTRSEVFVYNSTAK